MKRKLLFKRKKLIYTVFILLTFILGGIIYVNEVNNNSIFKQGNYDILTYMVLFVLVFLYVIVLAFVIADISQRVIKKISKYRTIDVIMAVIGGIVGLIVGNLLSVQISKVPHIGIYLSILITFICAITGAYIGIKREKDMLKIFNKKDLIDEESYGKNKYIDSSVLIDGRILDIAKTGFLEGVFYVPDFVISELQLISDSDNDMKRERGRRGLDMIKKLQQEKAIKIEVYNSSEVDFGELVDVDSKLVKLAKLDFGEIITTDYNLNKVADVQNIKVLNINDLANSIKAIMIPGEKVIINIIKKGKTDEQGVGYLNDGTMFIVEDGGENVGEDTEVTVTNIMQTSAGRLIFGRINLDE